MGTQLGSSWKTRGIREREKLPGAPPPKLEFLRIDKERD